MQKLKLAISGGFLLFAVVAVFYSSQSNVTASTKLDENGAALFKANCASCHGEDAKGDTGPNLTDPQRQAKWKDSDEKIVAKITNGGRRMPAFGEKLSVEKIKAIAGFVRSLGAE